MSREKQIEEIADILCEAKEHDCKGGNDCLCVKQAEALYNAGYRKQSEWISVDERLPRESEGEWLQDEESKFVHRYHCSVCNFYLIGEPTKYCEDCGAKMRGVRKVQNENIVKVVRCKDCEFRETKECPQITLPLDDYGFCSFGEQKMKGGAE